MKLPARVLLLAACAFAPAVAQQEPAEPAPHKTAVVNEIFSGTVTQVTPDSITVVRKVPAKKDVPRTFSRDAQTKIEGLLRVNARVAVRYQEPEPGQFLALHVVVRQ